MAQRQTEIGTRIWQDPNFGGALTDINPKTGIREPIVESNYDPSFLGEQDGMGQTNPGPQYGFESENPGWNRYMGPESASSSGGALWDFLESPTPFLMAAGGIAAAGVGAGAGVAGAEGAGLSGLSAADAAALADSYAVGSGVGDAVLTGSAGTDLLGGGVEGIEHSFASDIVDASGNMLPGSTEGISSALGPMTTNPGLPQTPPLPKSENDRLNTIKNLLSITSAAGSLLGAGDTGDANTTGGTLRADEAARQAKVNQNLALVQQTFGGFDDKYYQSISDAFKNYAMPQVNRLFDDTTRQTIYKAPGGVGSSNFANKLGEVEGDRAKAISAVGDEAFNEAQNARSSIEGTRANLTGLAESSEEPGAFAAQALAAAESAARPPAYSPLADLFSRYATTAMNAGVEQRGTPASQRQQPLSFGSSGGSSKTLGWR